MKTDHIVVENIVVDVVKKDIRNVHLRVLPPFGRVKVTAPIRLNNNSIRLFVMSKLQWIKKHQLKFESIAQAPAHEFVSGEIHHYMGRQYELNVVYHDSRPRVELLNEGTIDLYVRMGSNLAQREKVLDEWYRGQLRDQIPGLIEKWQYTIGVEAASWSVKKMKTRWGSCMVNSKRICFNLELAKRSPYCLEFIVVHELTHLLERFHNKRFKLLMDSFMPEWRICRDELNSTIARPGC